MTCQISNHTQVSAGEREGQIKSGLFTSTGQILFKFVLVGVTFTRVGGKFLEISYFVS